MSIQFKRGNEGAISGTNLLLDGQPGVEKLSGGGVYLKIGDGTTQWSNLPYLKSPFSSITDLPTTLEGYGITDAFKGEIILNYQALNQLWEPGVYYIVTSGGSAYDEGVYPWTIIVTSSSNTYSGYRLVTQLAMCDNLQGIYTRTMSVSSSGSVTGTTWYHTPYFTGAQTASNRVVITNSDYGGVTTSAVTSTELGYLDGVTSSIQTQLNDKANYETGTWTPNMGTSYSARSGRYVKVGNLVYVTSSITYSSAASGSGTFYITGLPFSASTSPTGYLGQFTIYSSNGDGWFGNTNNVTAIDTGVYFSGTSAYPYYVHKQQDCDTYIWTRTQIGEAIGSSGTFRMSGVYYTTV